MILVNWFIMTTGSVFCFIFMSCFVGDCSMDRLLTLIWKSHRDHRAMRLLRWESIGELCVFGWSLCTLWGHLVCVMWQFEDYRDADDAIYGRDGYKFDGHRLRVSIHCSWPACLDYLPFFFDLKQLWFVDCIFWCSIGGTCPWWAEAFIIIGSV